MYNEHESKDLYGAVSGIMAKEQESKAYYTKKQLRDNQQIHFTAKCDNHIILDVNLGYDYDTIINLTQVARYHFQRSEAQQLNITITKEN
jgi:hypothetical protein